MLSFDFSNCLSETLGWENGVTKEDLVFERPRISAAHDQLQKWRMSKDAAFFDYPFEKGLANKFRNAGEKIQQTFENLVVLGIGGSALGLRCLAQALLPPYANLIERKHRKNAPRLFVCDNIDPDTFGTLLETIDLHETCFNVISKSGNTTETMAQLFILLPMLKTKLGSKWKEHVIVTTDPESGPLRRFVVEESLESFDVPPKLGGRFSVLSAVGLFPAACLGIDIEAVLDGAHEMVMLCKEDNLETNPAYKNAAISDIMISRKGKRISVMMPYSDRLALFADWYAQLVGESLGKGGTGITPIKALGSTDQHSQIQLYMDGPNDKVITILGVESFEKKNIITNVMEPFKHLKGHSLGEILIASQKATTQALTVAKRPNVTITLSSVSPQAIGGLFMHYEIYTAIMGALLEVNPFDQPGVELGKKLTRQILEQG